MAESVYRIVEFVRVVCPRCGNARVPVQRTERVWGSRAPLKVVAVIRHHVCGGCGLRFQSQEAPAKMEGEIQRRDAEGAEERREGGRQEEGEAGAAGAAAEEVNHEGAKGTKKAGKGKR